MTTTDKIRINDKIGPDRHYKIEAFRKDIRVTQPHKHKQYFEIIYLSGGSGFHWIDEKRHEISAPVFFFLNRDQLHYWELTGEPEGFVIILKNDFIARTLDNELKLLLSKLSGQNCLEIQDTTSIDQLFELLVRENKPGDENTFHIIEGLLKALLAKVLEVANPFSNRPEIRSDLYQAFLELLNKGTAVKNTVHYYAEKLNTSPQNLNAVCRKAVNQSATDVLATSVISEAKRLLHYTNSTVSEIAFSLNFTDASHFVKYFKRITGQTPQSYRKSSN